MSEPKPLQKCRWTAYIEKLSCMEFRWRISTKEFESNGIEEEITGHTFNSIEAARKDCERYLDRNWFRDYQWGGIPLEELHWNIRIIPYTSENGFYYVLKSSGATDARGWQVEGGWAHLDYFGRASKIFETREEAKKDAEAFLFRNEWKHFTWEE